LCELFWKLFRIGSGIDRGYHCATRRLMIAVTARRVVIRDDDVRTQQANLQHHASQDFFFTAPDRVRLFRGLRKTKIAEAEEVWFRALHFSGGHRLARADHTELFVELRTDRVLSAFAEGREKRDGVHAVLAAQDRERAAVLVVRMRRDTHHRPGARE